MCIEYELLMFFTGYWSDLFFDVDRFWDEFNQIVSSTVYRHLSLLSIMTNKQTVICPSSVLKKTDELISCLVKWSVN